jgi:pimeloyl-ACP methyl ester carboxylesterase
MNFSRAIAFLFAALSVLPVAAQTPYQPVAAGKLRGQPYASYTTRDSLGRQISFYLSEATGEGSTPLVVYVHGSGNASHFTRAADRIRPANGHATIVDAARGRTRVLIVEKPGVVLFDSGGATLRPEFRVEHTLERWAEAVVASVVAASRLPDVDSTRVLVVGHSEGGLVAARVARRLTSVSHVALLAGGGPSQLFDLRLLARSGAMFEWVATEPEEREAYVLAQWDSILASPESVNRTFFGHAYRRWASFLRASPIAELRATNARLFVAQGANDRAVSRESFDALVSELQGMGRRPLAMLVPDADHSFAIIGADGQRKDGWLLILTQLLDWYSRDRTESASSPP